MKRLAKPETQCHPLAALLDGVAADRFPPADGGVTILPQPSPREAGVLAFTAHSAGHPRVARALRYRDHVRIWEVPGGIVMLGRGVAGRWEVAMEVDPDHRGRGLGRELAAAARHLVPDGSPLWAQITPGNAASVRAFLAAGYQPVGSEVLLRAATG